MSAPTLKYLIGKATPGPITPDREANVRAGAIVVEARKQLIARANPATLLAVYEALESCRSPLDAYVHGDEEISPARINQMLQDVNIALNLLNATES